MTVRQELKRKLGENLVEEKMKRTRKEHERKGQAPAPPEKLRFGTRSRRWSSGEQRLSHARAEHQERERWLEVIVQELKDLDAPSWQEAQKSSDPGQTLRVQLGAKRASTLRSRVREWRRIREWLMKVVSVNVPQDSMDVLDYLRDRFEEPCTKGVLRNAYACFR